MWEEGIKAIMLLLHATGTYRIHEGYKADT